VGADVNGMTLLDHGVSRPIQSYHGVSVLAHPPKIDLDDCMYGSQNRFYEGIPVVDSGDVMSDVYRRH
jgi:hypothetical protein